MESPKPTTRKRKQLQRAPRTSLDGAVTRSKTRSGSDGPHRSADIHEFLLPAKKNKTRSRRGGDDELFGDGQRVSVKDLRARRIFSKKPTGDDHQVLGEEGCGKKDGFEGVGEGVDGFVAGNPIDVVAVVEMGLLCEDGVVGSVDLVGKGSAVGSDDGKLKSGEVCEIGREESAQTTPPPPPLVDVVVDDDVVVAFADEQRGTADEGDHAVLMPSKGCESNSGGCGKKCSSPLKVDRSKDSGFNRIPVLKPCSRLKIYKAPSSISYRRLLPYLMDIAKDRSCEVQTMLCAKGDQCSEKKPPQSAVMSTLKLSFINTSNVDEIPGAVADSLFQDTSNAAHNKESVFPEHKTTSYTTQHTVAQSPTEITPDGKHLAAEYQIGSLVVEQVSSQDLGNIDLSIKNMSTDVGSVQTAEFVCHDNGLEGLPAGARLNTTTDSTACASEDLCSPNINGVVPSQPRVSNQANGILKRNPRGCRGPCSCLDCTSFRLHAGRAFEFSRNQMHDAEELTLHLMKELSCLQSVLENFVCNAVNDVALPVHQIKEACAKASNAEDLARKRLIQMKADLFVHCRTKTLQRPKVNFDPHIVKKISENCHAGVKPAQEN
ncbi:hypothetical protein Droror1_Dr00015274 [Drosera rotundifolia]